MKFVRTNTGQDEGRIYELTSHLMIGRGRECDVRLDSSGASRKHALVMLRGDGAVMLRDLGSRNGTLVAGERVRSRILEPGARFIVSDVEFELTVTGDLTTDGGAEAAHFGSQPEETTEEYDSESGTWKQLLRLARELRMRQPSEPD